MTILDLFGPYKWMSASTILPCIDIIAKLDWYTLTIFLVPPPLCSIYALCRIQATKSLDQIRLWWKVSLFTGKSLTSIFIYIYISLLKKSTFVTLNLCYENLVSFLKKMECYMSPFLMIISELKIISYQHNHERNLWKNFVRFLSRWNWTGNTSVTSKCCGMFQMNPLEHSNLISK